MALSGAVIRTGRELVEKGIAEARGLVDRAAVVGSHVLRRSETGKQMVNMFEEAWQAARLRAGRDQERVLGVLKGFGDEDVAHIADVMEGLDNAKSPKHWDAAAQLHGIIEEYSDDAMEVGLRTHSGLAYQKAYEKYLGKKVTRIVDGMPTEVQVDHRTAVRLASKESQRPFMPMPNYIPHYYSEAAIAKYMAPGPDQERILQLIMKQGWTDDKATAKRYLERMLRQPAEFRGGPLQHSRDFNLPGYERDLRKVLPRYVETSSARLEMARRFGPRDEVANNMLTQIGKEATPNEARIANNLYLAVSGSRDPQLKELARGLGTLHTITLLGTAGILQPSQLMNVVARAGWVNTFKASSEVFRDWAKYAVTGRERPTEAFARETGALFDSSRADLQFDSIDDLPGVWMRIIGLQQLDSLNRVVAANAGRVWANQMTAKLMRKGTSPRQMQSLIRDLKFLGVDAGQVMERGFITPEEIRGAGLVTARDTQFASRPWDLPELRSTPAGRFMYLFKSFAFQQADFVYKMGKEYEAGQKAPLTRLVTALPLTALTLGEGVRWLKGREAPEDPAVRTLEDMAIVGFTGAFYDLWRAMAHGPESIASYVLGPSAGEAMQVAGVDLPAIAEGVYTEGAPNFQPLLGHMVRRVPLIGQPLYNAWWKVDMQ